MDKQLSTMTLRAIKTIIVAISVSQCTGATNLADNRAAEAVIKSKLPPSKVSQSTNQITGTQSEIEVPVDEPVSVAGSFLTCAYSDLANPNNKVTYVSCKWTDDTGAKLEPSDDDDGSMTWSYDNPNTNLINVQQRVIQESPFWSVEYTISSLQEMTPEQLIGYANFVEVQLSVEDPENEDNPEINLANSIYTANAQQRSTDPKPGYSQYRLYINSNADECAQNATVIEELILYKGGIKQENSFFGREGTIGNDDNEVPAFITASHKGQFFTGVLTPGWAAFSDLNQDTLWISNDNPVTSPFSENSNQNAITFNSVFLQIDFGTGNQQTIDGFFINGGGTRGDWVNCLPDEFALWGSNNNRDYTPLPGLAGTNSNNTSFGSAIGAD
ncbi:MAG: hypothetical protein CMP10_16505 [Zetaproteobacteria bacterium]|nr:hypothetical protein [Pseudobdellovibrionaceae bacterium]